MSITLSSTDVEKLSRAARLLVSPLNHARVDDWRSAVNRCLSDLLGADSAGFLLPVSEGLPLYSEEHDAAALARFQDYPPPPLIDGASPWERALRNRVTTAAEIYGDNYDLYLNSAYYREYAGANGAHDTLVATLSLGGIDARGIASIQLWHARPDGRRFGQRELTLLKLVYPAFCAGVEAQMRWGKQRADLLNTLDVLRQGVLVCDRSGRVLHRTPAFTAMMALDPQADELYGQIMAAAAAVGRTAAEPIASGSQPISSPVVEVRTGTARYILRASLYGGPPAGCTEYVLVSVDRRTPSPLSDTELREKFGLTPAETRVARLIAQGLSNDAISHELSISPHTARRHTERILQKINIRSRAEVGVKLVA